MLYDTYMLLDTDLSCLVDPTSKSWGGSTSDWGACTVLVGLSGYTFSLWSGFGFLEFQKNNQPMAMFQSRSRIHCSCHVAKKPSGCICSLKSLGQCSRPCLLHTCDNIRSNILHLWPLLSHMHTKHNDIQHLTFCEWVEAGDIHYAYYPHPQ